MLTKDRHGRTPGITHRIDSVLSSFNLFRDRGGHVPVLIKGLRWGPRSLDPHTMVMFWPLLAATFAGVKSVFGEATSASEQGFTSQQWRDGLAKAQALVAQMTLGEKVCTRSLVGAPTASSGR